jgi:hypothetical protein
MLRRFLKGKNSCYLSIFMQKVPQQISYSLAKISFGIYLVEELRSHGGKDMPTETDVRKILLRINPSCTAAELQTARQVSRYCQTNKNYLQDAREETLDKVAKAINAPIKSFVEFREKINPLLKAFKYYSGYVEQAEAYVRNLQNTDSSETKKKFCELFDCGVESKVYLSLISYHFGAENKDLPAVSFGAESDLRTERIIRGLFDGFELPVPQYLPENIFFEQLGAQKTKSSFIAVGLFGNRLTEWMSTNNCLPSGLQILPAEKCIKLRSKTYYANRDEQIDYALFCKLTLSSNSTIFIIGGIEGFGTQRLGEYIEDNWQAVYQQTAHKQTAVLLYKTGKDTIEHIV